jgi:hypothetical protein
MCSRRETCVILLLWFSASDLMLSDVNGAFSVEKRWALPRARPLQSTLDPHVPVLEPIWVQGIQEDKPARIQEPPGSLPLPAVQDDINMN